MGGDNAVKVTSLVKMYGDLAAVDGVTFSVKKGEIFAFLGPNGAGKTTTVEILECLRVPTSGEARVLGYDVRKEGDQREIRKRIGVLPEYFSALDRLTVKENVEFFGKMFDTRVDVDELIRLVRLEDKRKELFKNLSSGLKQRLGLAVALVNDPELIFLDEPTSGLDPRARRDVWDVMKGLKAKDKTIFFTTHYMEEAQELADTVSIIDRGKIIVEGAPEELIFRHGGVSVLVFKKGGETVGNVLSPKFPGVEVTVEGDVLMPLRNKSDVMEAVMALSRGNVGAGELEIRKPTLEQVFLNLTGEGYRGGGSHMRRVVAIFMAFMKSWRRSKSDIFWTVAFPVFMILLFGFIFGEQSAKIDLYVQDQDQTMLSRTFIDALNQTEALNLYSLPPEVDGLTYVMENAKATGRGERLLIIPKGFQTNATLPTENATVIIFLDETQQPSLIALGVVRGVLDAFNIQVTEGSKIFSLEQRSVVAERIKYIDFFIPGVIAMTVMTIGIHGSIEVNTVYREKGIIKKLASTPLSKLEWILGVIANQIFLSFLSAAIILVVGWTVFRVTVMIDAYFIILIAAGSLLFPGLGMLVTNFVREPEAGSAAAEAISLPMMFLAGIFYPLEMLPEFLQKIARVMPLYYLGDGLRDAMINADPAGALTNTLIIVSLAAVFIMAGTFLTSLKEE